MGMQRAQDRGMQRSPGRPNVIGKTRTPRQERSILDALNGSPDVHVYCLIHPQPGPKASLSTARLLYSCVSVCRTSEQGAQTAVDALLSR
jgi:hypothetical protein